MKYDFDHVLNRQGTGAMKWDRSQKFVDVTGRDDINSLWVADMDFPCARPITDAIADRAAHPVYGYTYFDGSGFFEAVAGWNHERYDRKVRLGDIFYAPGVVFAVAAAIRAFTEPGEGVVIQTPVYYPFKKMIERNGRTVVENPLLKDSGYYTMAIEDLEEKASRDDVKLMILCSPHNPVGRIWNRDELKAVSDICNRNGVLLLSDEIHADIIRDGQTFIPAANAGKKDNIITFNAPSKTFNIPGLMVSWVIIENEELKTKWTEEAYHKTGMSLPNPFGLVAGNAAYTEGLDWLKQVNEYIDDNLSFMKEYIDANLPDVRYMIPEGTYLAWLDMSGTGHKDDDAFSDMICEKAGILVDPGSIFGEQGRGFIRINTACPRHRLEDALKKIKDLL